MSGSPCGLSITFALLEVPTIPDGAGIDRDAIGGVSESGLRAETASDPVYVSGRRLG